MREPWVFENISFPRFGVTCKPALTDELLKYSALPEGRGLVFHLDWSELELSTRAGAVVIKDAAIYDSYITNGGWSEVDFATLTMPVPDFLVEHAGLTLAQMVKYRIQEAAKVISVAAACLRGVIDDTSFKRDIAKTKDMSERVQALSDTLQTAIPALDFTDVLLPRDKREGAEAEDEEAKDETLNYVDDGSPIPF